MHDGRQQVPRATTVATAAWWAVAGTVFVAAVLGERRLHDIGRAELGLTATVLVVYASSIASSGAVATVLLVRRGRHPVGWAFGALATALVVSLFVDTYVRLGLSLEDRRLPAVALSLFLNDPLFVVFIASVAVALQLTPTGAPVTPRWAWVTRATIATSAVSYLAGTLVDQPLAPQLAELHIRNPLTTGARADVAAFVQNVATALAAAGLVAGAASVVVRFRRASGEDRQQLLWLVVAVVPLPLFVAAALLIDRRGDSSLTPIVLVTAGWIVLVPIGIGLCITRYNLFEVERILSRTATYTALCGVVAAVYTVVVVAAGRALSGRADLSGVATVLATLVAVSVAAPARGAIQASIDRRFNRRRFDALRVVREHLHSPADGDPIDEVLRRALADPSLAVAYWVDDRRQWVTGAGRPAPRAPHSLVVRRGDAPVALVTFDEALLDRANVAAAAAAALPELDNARLRAALALQLVEVNESRSRIASAQFAERRRIERNLHDGAQQRLLALGFELRAAHLNGDPCRLASAVADGIGQVRVALTELRDLANGLHPAVLSDGGLSAALDDLAGRAAGPVSVSCPDARFAPEVEAAAWFVICEAVTNAFKHASPRVVAIDVDHIESTLVVAVRDDGCGGADQGGAGLQGLRDRAEAAGGTLEVGSSPEGTTVGLRLPCGW